MAGIAKSTAALFTGQTSWPCTTHCTDQAVTHLLWLAGDAVRFTKDPRAPETPPTRIVQLDQQASHASMGRQPPQLNPEPVRAWEIPCNAGFLNSPDQRKEEYKLILLVFTGNPKYWVDHHCCRSLSQHPEGPDWLLDTAGMSKPS